jgi:apolipoprotein N-acyltransferase
MNAFLILVSFFLVAFGQPAWIRGFGVLAAAFGFALFWRAIISVPRPRDRFLYSLAWFTAVQGVQLSWMANTAYMGPMILVVYLFLILGMGAQFGILSYFLSLPMSWRQIFAMAGCWTIFEWVRLFFLCGFTWNPIGLSLADSSYSLQFASIWGIFGLSFWVILVNLVALSAMIEKSTRKAVVWASLAFFPYLFGFIHQTWIEARVPISGTLDVALVQTALFPEQKDYHFTAPDDYVLPHEQWERIFSVLDRKRKVDLIVFPEAALPLGAHKLGYEIGFAMKYFHPQHFPLFEGPDAQIRRGDWRVSNSFLLQTLANEMGASVIAGLDDVDFTGMYNAAFHFSPKNLPHERYEKRVLAPIAEYIPLRQWRRFSRFVAEQFGIYSSFDPGTKVKIFKSKFPIGVSICLEETFSNLTRELRREGAELFVNLTNDIWFPNSKLPRQHFDHGRVRAAENGVSILRACNTGITGWVDCFGRSLAQLPASETEASALYLTLPVRSYATLYTWWGDEAILGISAGSMLFYFLFRKKKLL